MASSILTNCPFTDPDDICRWLRDQIHKKVLQEKSETGTRGLRERIMDQVYGRNGPTNADGTPNRSWQTHDDEIKKLRRNVQEHLEEHDRRGCGDGFPISPGVKHWVRTPNPRPADWKGPRPVEPTARRSLLDLKYWEEATGLAGGALILYLVVSEGSRLFPPRNLVPVP